MNFKNNGYSEVAMFGFKEDETAPPFDSSIIVYTSGEVPVNCSCKEEPSGTGEAEIKEGDVVTIGEMCIRDSRIIESLRSYLLPQKTGEE